MMWVEKYRPKSVEEMVGNEKVRISLISWLRKWQKGSKAALLVGPPGIGKTTLARLLAKMERYNMVELNASDTRTRETLSRKIGEATRSESLVAQRTLIFLDEIDGITGRADYGAVEFVKEAVRQSMNPILMAANDEESDQVRKLGEVCQVFKLRPPPPREIVMYLKHILEEEGLEIGDERLSEIAVVCRGDIRYAINMLQAGLSESKERSITTQESITLFLSSKDESEAMDALSMYPGQPRDKVREIFSSIVRSRVRGEKRGRMLRCISDADILLGRINATGNWRLLRHLDKILAGCMIRELRGEKIAYTRESIPWELQVRIWNRSKRLKEIYGLLAGMLRTSSSQFVSGFLPYISVMLESGEFAEKISSITGVGTEELDLLKEFGQI